MSEDGEEKAGRLGDQLGELDIDAPDREERADSQQEAEASESGESDADDSESAPERQFEEALEDLSDEDLRARKFDRGTDESARRGTLADELEELEPEQYPEAAGEEAGSTGVGETRSEGDGGEPETPESLEAALEGMSPDEMRARKFGGDPGEPDRREGAGGPSGTSSADGEPESKTGASAGPNREAGDDANEEVDEEVRREFERAMYDVDPIEEDSKYRQRDARDPDTYFDEEQARTPEDFPTPRLPKSGEALNDIPKLGDAQEAMLERCEQWEKNRDVPELNLRGEKVDEAQTRLGPFFEQARAQDTRFVRIVHGKGRRSDGPPAIKPAVLKWLERSAADWIRGYAPEREFGGDYGSTVVELLDHG